MPNTGSSPEELSTPGYVLTLQPSGQVLGTREQGGRLANHREPPALDIQACRQPEVEL